MRLVFFLSLWVLLFASCGKDKYTTEPQLSFIDLKPNFDSSTHPVQLKEFAPKLILEVRDGEGDIGASSSGAISKVYVKNLSSNFIDSFPFPTIVSGTGKNFKAEVDVNLFDCMDCLNRPRPYIDTTFYEVYVTDLAGNRSNVITTSKALYLLCL
jgi:hypothetical protein